MMRSGNTGLVFAAVLLIAAAPLGQAAEDGGAPAVTRIDDDRYQVGKVIVDRTAGEFRVPGTVLEFDRPLEYIAVSTGGRKAYESLLEVEATGTEFNLACILIGLDADKSTLPEYQFDLTPLEGQAVEIFIEWGEGEEKQRDPAIDLVTLDDESREGSDWVYTGGATMVGKPPVYLPDSLGTLVGFVHDPASVIEHRTGLGIGAYGSLQADARTCPPTGTPVTLIVRRVPEASE